MITIRDDISDISVVDSLKNKSGSSTTQDVFQDCII